MPGWRAWLDPFELYCANFVSFIPLPIGSHKSPGIGAHFLSVSQASGGYIAVDGFTRSTLRVKPHSWLLCGAMYPGLWAERPHSQQPTLLR